MNYKIFVAVLIVVLVISGFFIFNNFYKKLPEGISNGDVIHCTENGAIYKIENNQKRWYPNPDVYSKHGKPKSRAVSCNVIAAIPSGPNFS